MMEIEIERVKWLQSPKPTNLADDITHLYRINLNEETIRGEHHLTWLNQDEQVFSRRLKQKHKRQCFITTRSILRQLLAHYTGIPHDKLSILRNPHGKPYTDGIEFNISHSRQWALIAFNRSRPVGIDVQHMKPALDFDRIALRRYAEKEKRQLESEPDTAKRREKFFAIWTRKEAYVKAHGTSFYDKISSLNLPLGQDKIDDEVLGGSWELHTFKIGTDYWATVCAENRIGNIGCYDWWNSNHE